MCQRKDAVKDPLANLLFNRYALHMLSLPRAGVSVGDVYVYGKAGLVGSGRISDLFVAGFELPAVATGERAIRLEDTTSNELNAKAGLSLLDKLFDALHFGNAAQVRAAYEAQHATKMRFAFESPTRDSVNILSVSDRLYLARPKALQFKESEQFYLVTAVLRSKGIAITATAEDGKAVDVSATVKALADVSGRLSISTKDGTALVYIGDEPLGFGVELVELAYDPVAGRVDRREVSEPVPVRSKTRAAGQFGPSIVGDPELADLFI